MPDGGAILDKATGISYPIAKGGYFGSNTDILYQSEGHPRNPKTGKREGGGPFHVTHSRAFVNPGSISDAASTTYPSTFCTSKVMVELHQLFNHPLAAKYNGSLSPTPPDMDAEGATAIAQVAPINPTANLGTTLAETFREGIPSLPGIQTWRDRTNYLKSLGSEYLNYQFGWAPLVSEVHSVVGAARHHRDIMQNYDKGEGTNVHRRFDFDSVVHHDSEPIGSRYLTGNNVPSQFFSSGAECTLHVEERVNQWFVGCFTYGGPSKADNFKRALSFGKEADQVYGLSLTPSLLWELAPWSWAVDWFTNTGDVITNVTNFATAGLVMRYGYMMRETIRKLYVTWDDCLVQQARWNSVSKVKEDISEVRQGGGGAIGYESVEKSRSPANPFGFGIGWEDLSPTQLAITAAIGITRLL
jgi:hypothetical protein